MSQLSKACGRIAGFGGRVVLVTVLSGLAGCEIRNSFLDPAGPIAEAQRSHLLIITLLVMIVVLPAIILVPIFAWRYRYGKSVGEYRPNWEFSTPLEFVLWGVPVAIVAILSVILWRSTHDLDPYRPLDQGVDALRVQVVGLDWKWLFVYPDAGVATVGELAFPANRPLALELTSDTVMQSFFIPALGSQIYAMAGMVTKLHLKADGPTRVQGENTQFNGKGFHEQKFAALALTREEYEAWLANVREHGIPLDEKTFDLLSRPSTLREARDRLGEAGMPEQVIYLTDVKPRFFEEVVGRHRKHEGGAGTKVQ